MNDELNCVACEGKPAGTNNPCAVCGRATPPSPSTADVAEVKIERGRVWIVKGNQSFMLAYVPDEGDDPAEIQAYADNLRAALTGFTPCVNQDIAPSTAPTASANGGLLEHAKVAETRMDTGFGGGHLASARSASAPIAEDERAAFEAWWQKDALKSWRSTLLGSEYGKPMPDGWGDGYKRHALCAWQARAALSSRPAGEVEELRALVEEWLCESCNTVYPGPPARGFACVICPKCGGSTGPRMLMENRKLRAELALRTAGEVELPPLPEPACVINKDCHLRETHWNAYTADQLRAYGQECAHAALASKPAAQAAKEKGQTNAG